MKAELKNVKIAEFLSEETTAFTATLYIDGKKVGFAKNDGRGGNNSIYHLSSKERPQIQAFYEWAAEQPPNISEFGELPMSGDFYITLLVGAMEEEKELKGWCRKGIVLYEEGEYTTIKRTFTHALVPALNARYPKAEVVNLRFL